MAIDTFEGKIAFVTGGASGIGLGIAKELVRRGAQVVLADLRQDHIDDALAEFAGGERSNAVTAINLDVTSREKYAEAAQRMQDEFGGVDILVNNAGVGLEGSALKATYADFDFGFGVNIGGVINGFMSFLPQMIAHGKGWLDKAAASNIAENDLVNAKLTDDMLPFKYQIKSMAVHSQGAIEGLRKGVFAPDMDHPPQTFADLQAKLDGAIAFLEGISAEEMEGFVGKDMRFEIGERKIEFVAEEFLTTFSLANFFFHSTTAYGILRSQGVEVGKRDFLGQLRTKG